MESRLIRHTVEAQLEGDRKVRREFGKHMRGRIAALIDAPREDNLAHLTPTRGKTFSDRINLNKHRVKFVLESDHIDTAKASGISISFPDLEETMIIYENGDADIKEEHKGAMSHDRPVADLDTMMEYYGYLGVIESQFPIQEVLPPGVLRFPSKSEPSAEDEESPIL